MSEEFEVLLADGISRLHGRAGEWLVDYGDGSLGIIAEAIFAANYRDRRLSTMALHQVIQRLLLIGAQAQVAPAGSRAPGAAGPAAAHRGDRRRASTLR